MAAYDLTAAELRSVVDYAPETGQMTWRTHVDPLRIGTLVGYVTKEGYRRTFLNGSLFYAHRLAWMYVTGRFPAATIDHINGNRLDNRIANLRDVPFSRNGENIRQPKSNNKSGFLGVTLREYPSGLIRWRASMTVGRKSIHIGFYDTPDEAHSAYLIKKRDAHAGCTI